MKKTVLLILFLTGITPVFKNNSLNLGCSQAYAQESPTGLEEVVICSKNETSTSKQLGDWLVTTTCHLVLEDNECVSVCSDNNVYSPADGGQGDTDPNGDGSGGGSGGSGGGTGGTGGQQSTPKYGVPPITKEEFEKLKSIDWKNHNYNIQVKENCTLTIKETGIKVLGQLTKIESNIGEKFYKFTPYNSTGPLQKDLYYHYDAKYIESSITYYTLNSDTTGFPISGWAYLGGLFDSWGQPLKIEIEPNDSPIVIINDVPLTMKNWYLDEDTDKYHSRIMQASSRPGQAWMEGTSRGLDCNDNDYRATTDCRPEWILDKDGDGYHQSTVRSNTSPGLYWVKGRPIETDCNDNAYNATNNCTMLKWYTDEDKDGWANILDSVAQPGPNWTNWPMQGPDCDDSDNTKTSDCQGCGTKEKAKAKEITTFANDPIVKAQILLAQTSAKTDAFERSTVINKDATTSALTTPGLGAAGTANSTTMTPNSTTELLLHSHPDNAGSSVYPTHSVGDIYGLNVAYTAYNSVDYSMTVGITNAYMLVVENPTQLATFIADNPQAKTLVPNTGNLKPNTPLYDDFNNAFDYFDKQGVNIDDAYASAMAYFLQCENTGMVLYESTIAADGTTDFHRKNTSATVTTAQPATATTLAVPEKTTYTKNDCQ